MKKYTLSKEAEKTHATWKQFNFLASVIVKNLELFKNYQIVRNYFRDLTTVGKDSKKFGADLGFGFMKSFDGSNSEYPLIKNYLTKKDIQTVVNLLEQNGSLSTKHTNAIKKLEKASLKPTTKTTNKKSNSAVTKRKAKRTFKRAFK